MSYLKLGPLNLQSVAQGVGGLVFGNGEQSDDDGGVEQLLERISNGRLAEDRRAAMGELRDAVAENPTAQMAFGAMGLPVLTAVLGEEREDVEMVRGALEALINALVVLTPPQGGKAAPGRINAELFAREAGSVQLLLSLLQEDDFYVRYHTVQLLTVLLQNSPGRLQEAILGAPMGVARLMDMLGEREVIRNEALLLLIFLTRSAEEIQKIVVFEGAFERLFHIVTDEGSSDGGIIVQDCLELLNNLLRNNPSNQTYLRETVGLSAIPGLLKLRKAPAENLPRQKAINLLCALETVTLLLARNANMPPGQEANIVANQTLLTQNALLDVLVPLAVDPRLPSVGVRAQALRCLGDAVARHGPSQVALGSKLVGEAGSEPALHAVLHAALRAGSPRERAAAEYVFRCFCEGNPEGQTTLASTILPLPSGVGRGSTGADDEHASFGSILVRALVASRGQGDLEASCRAAGVLLHILKDNRQCKERVLTIPLEIASSASAQPDLLLPRCLRYLSSASTYAAVNGPAAGSSAWLPAVFLRLLVTWLNDCPPAVTAFLASPAHLPLVADLTNSTGSPASVHIAGLAAVLLGVCLLYCPPPSATASASKASSSASTILDLISQRIGLPKFFGLWENMRQTTLFHNAATAPKLPAALTRATAAAAVAGDVIPGGGQEREENGSAGPKDDVDASLTTFYDAEFVKFVVDIEGPVKARSLELYARPNAGTSDGNAAEFEALPGETEAAQVERLKELLRAQSHELLEVRENNAALAQDLMAAGESSGGLQDGAARESLSMARSLQAEPRPKKAGGTPLDIARVKAETEALKKQVAELQRVVQQGEVERAALQEETARAQQLAEKHEADLRSLSNAYNTLEQENYRLEAELKQQRSAPGAGPSGQSAPSEEALAQAREEGREVGAKEAEGEMNDLLVCLGQEEAKVEKLREALEALGEDVDKLLEGIADGEGGDDEEDDVAEPSDEDA